MNKAIRNERRKLSAAYLNGLATAVFAVGVLSPFFSFAYGNAVLPLGVIPVLGRFGHLHCGERGPTFGGATSPRRHRRMTAFEYLLLVGIAPVGALIVALVVLRVAR